MKLLLPFSIIKSNVCGWNTTQHSARVQAVTVLDPLSPALPLKLKTTRVSPKETREGKKVWSY